jgi:hypothetical protein
MKERVARDRHTTGDAKSRREISDIYPPLGLIAQQLERHWVRNGEVGQAWKFELCLLKSKVDSFRRI